MSSHNIMSVFKEKGLEVKREKDRECREKGNSIFFKNNRKRSWRVLEISSMMLARI